MGTSLKWRMRIRQAPDSRVTSSPTSSGILTRVCCHRVALPDGDSVVVWFERIEIDRHADGRADLVLAAVSPSDALRIVVLDQTLDGPGAADPLVHLSRQGNELLVTAERQDRDLHRRQRGVELQNHAGLRSCLTRLAHPLPRMRPPGT